MKAGGEADDRGWDSWMASPTRWMWVWANSRRWWRMRKPSVLQSMASQRVGHDCVTELNMKCKNFIFTLVKELLSWNFYTTFKGYTRFIVILKYYLHFPCFTCRACQIASVVSDSLRSRDYIQPMRLLCPWDSPGKNTEWVTMPSPPGDLPDTGIEPVSPALQADFFTGWATSEAIHPFSLSYTQQFVPTTSPSLNFPSLHSPLVTTRLFSLSVSLLLFLL